MITDLFAGPGGMDVAARALKVKSVGIEWDDDAVATRLAARLDTIHGDVTKYGPADLPESDTLAGGPPCQGFSVAGRGEGRKRLDLVHRRVKLMAARETVPEDGLDERSALVLEPLRWILRAKDAGRPYRAVVLEQVQAARHVWEAYAEVLRAEGYAVAHGVLNAEQYGVPQTRRRAVLLARRDGDVALPSPICRPYVKDVHVHDGDPSLAPYVTMGGALPGRGPFTVISNYGTGGDPDNRGERTSHQPAFTVTGKISRNRLVGPDGEELPRFSWAEAGRLQDFPLDHPWSGRDIGQQIGNACPVGLAAALFRAVGVA
ncbi:DNA cytosine methyltransferase [Streptomyces sp. S1D4-14]|uniref:DNA cytosine methyltransferase n=1 Tax=Streptomyces sp. S1D4-14 TaxID=2594461 RepID=UPI00215A2996|nr:DNA cytosine methyltransferase [Streptomyces sp. S1D4-14]